MGNRRQLELQSLRHRSEEGIRKKQVVHLRKRNRKKWRDHQKERERE